MSPTYAKLSSESFSDDASLDGIRPWAVEESAKIRQTHYSGFMKAINLSKWPVVVVMLGFVVIAELIRLRGSMQARPQLLGELNGLVPTFPRSNVLFQRQQGFTSDHATTASINATKESWLSLMPKGNGFIEVHDPAQYTLPAPIQPAYYKGQKTVYSLAVFHQLHCLYHMMDNIDRLMIANRKQEVIEEDDDFWHIDHCFEYLRNGLMCCGDTTLEGQARETNLPGTDGTGAIHVCKNYDDILAWAEGERFTDLKQM